MRTIKLTIEYDGTHYAGWQIQPHKATIQGTIQDILRRITREKVDLIGASRTDAGVHALGQVAHFRTGSTISCNRFFIALAGLLPPDISVVKVEGGAAGFHAQKRAKGKLYLYRIWNGRARPALLRDQVWHIWDVLDLAAMRRGAGCLVGRHDFSAFRAHQSDTKTSVRRVERIKIEKSREMIEIHLIGDGFLKYMVRNIVGTLVAVGKGRLSPEAVKGILRSRDRKKAGATAPASGLYLVKISY